MANSGFSDYIKPPSTGDDLVDQMLDLVAYREWLAHKRKINELKNVLNEISVSLGKANITSVPYFNTDYLTKKLGLNK